MLPRQQLLGQWRECCAIAKNIAEKGTPNHVLVNRIMEEPLSIFLLYCSAVFIEMVFRGYKADFEKLKDYFSENDWKDANIILKDISLNIEYFIFRKWHNDRYLRQCIANLQEKYDCGAIPENEWKRITDEYPEWK